VVIPPLSASSWNRKSNASSEIKHLGNQVILAGKSI
jgi:hypothetical protein